MKTTTTKPKSQKKNAVGTAAVPQVSAPQTREQVMALCQETTRLTLERDGKQVALDRIVNRLKERRGEAIELLDARIAQNVAGLKAWAVAFREQEFGERQSIKLAGSKLEFRKGSGKVVCDAEEDQLLRQIQALPDGFAEEKGLLVREHSELNRMGVIAILRKEGGAALLNKLGLRVIVDEEFKFHPARGEMAAIPLVSGDPAAEVPSPPKGTAKQPLQLMAN